MSVLADEVVGSRGVRARERDRVMREKRADSVMCIVDVFVLVDGSILGGRGKVVLECEKTEKVHLNVQGTSR